MNRERVEEAKRRAAEEACRLVRDGQVLGVGTGSTVAYFIEALARRIRQEGLDIIAVPTSYQSRMLLISRGVRVASLDEYPELDLDVDGADEVDPSLNLIKGGGAAHAMEKVVAAASRRFVVIVDYTKLSPRIGSRKPVPVEVLPPALSLVRRRLEQLGASRVELRDGQPAKDGPAVTDNGNFILDAYFGPIEDPARLERDIKTIPGVVEVGIFAGMADEVIVGYPDRVEVLRRR